MHARVVPIAVLEFVFWQSQSLPTVWIYLL